MSVQPWIRISTIVRGVLAAAGMLMTVPFAVPGHCEENSEAPGSVTVPAPQPHAAASDTLTYWYGALYRTPFVLRPGTAQPANIARHAVEFTHASGWSMGSNFASVMVSQSDMAEPAANGGSGATEVYVTLRSGLGLNQLTGTTAFRRGPIANVNLELGANLETKNSAYAPAERTLYVGPQVQLAVPRGYVHVGFHLRKEWNHEGVLGKAENYAPDFNIEPSWLLPFRLGKVHLAYSGFAEYNTAKGRDSFGSETAPEFLVRNTVSVDLGALLFHRTQLVDVNGGFWYWHNEYGKPVSNPGAEQKAPMIGVTLHLDGGRAAGKR